MELYGPVGFRNKNHFILGLSVSALPPKFSPVEQFAGRHALLHSTGEIFTLGLNVVCTTRRTSVFLIFWLVLVQK